VRGHPAGEYLSAPVKSLCGAVAAGPGLGLAKPIAFRAASLLQPVPMIDRAGGDQRGDGTVPEQPTLCDRDPVCYIPPVPHRENCVIGFDHFLPETVHCPHIG